MVWLKPILCVCLPLWPQDHGRPRARRNLHLTPCGTFSRKPTFIECRHSCPGPCKAAVRSQRTAACSDRANDVQAATASLSSGHYDKDRISQRQRSPLRKRTVRHCGAGATRHCDNAWGSLHCFTNSMRCSWFWAARGSSSKVQWKPGVLSTATCLTRNVRKITQCWPPSLT